MQQKKPSSFSAEHAQVLLQRKQEVRERDDRYDWRSRVRATNLLVWTSTTAQFQHLRRKLAVMTASLESVFQFHAHLQQCVLEPEMRSVRLSVRTLIYRSKCAGLWCLTVY